MATNGIKNDSPRDSLIRATVKRLQRLSDNALPSELKDKTELAIIDYFGAIASGLQAPWAYSVIKYAKSRSRGVHEAHAWGLNEDIAVETAAFVNATLAHSAIRDDMHLKSNSHIGSIVISAALALAQRDQWTGEQLVKAIVGGYEAAALLGTAVQQSPGYNRHARPSGIVGAFGAAAAAVTATNVSEDVAVNALAFAANKASGFNEWAFAGGVEIYTEMGFAAQAGILAFDLATSGLECSETLLEGRGGLFAALNATKGEELYKAGLAAEIGRKGLLDVKFKPAPGCNYAQTPLAVALLAAQKHDLSGGIREVVLNCTSQAKHYPGCYNPGPFSTVQQTKMSIQFGVCAVLTDRAISEKLFTKFDDKRITELAARCEVIDLEAYDDGFREGRQPASIKVTLQDGSVVEEELGDVPWLDSEAVTKRFHDEMKEIGASENDRKRVVEKVEALDSLRDGSDIVKLLKQVNVANS